MPDAISRAPDATLESLPGGEADAIRMIERARTAIIWIALGSAIISHVWFWSIPMTETGFGNTLSPVLFGGITTDVSPMDGN